MYFNHVSVLLDECIDNLNIKPSGIYVDGTLGGAGHSLKICERLHQGGKLIGIDQDSNAIAKAKDTLKDYSDRTVFVNRNFSEIKEILEELNIHAIDGMLLDLGVSSHQLDEAERGFSYMNDAALDMRMNHHAKQSAYDIVNDYSAKELEAIIKNYGEERWAKRIAEFIVMERAVKNIETTFELVSVIKKAIPKAARSDGPHPAKRTFQAIRIEVNNELDILKPTIEEISKTLNVGGRICVITFHSLEDRIIKNAVRDLEKPCQCPLEFPVCVCGKQPTMKTVTRKPILPTHEELERNPRARSAKLRVGERL